MKLWLDRDLDPGTRDWIFSIQQRFAELQGAETAIHGKAAMPAEYLQEFRDGWKKRGISDSTPFENYLPERFCELDEVAVRASILNTIKQMEPFLQTQGFSTQDLFLSSVPSRSINAFCIREPGLEKNCHIFIDGELTTFIYLLAKCFAEILWDENDKFRLPSGLELIELLDLNDTGNRLIDLFNCTIVGGATRLAKPWLPSDAKKWPRISYLLEGMEQFVLGHEIGHFVKGHFERTQEDILTAENFPDVLTFSHDLEYEADIVGAEAVMHFMNGKTHPAALVLPIYIFMFAVDILAKGNYLFEDDTTDPFSSHPSPSKRIEKILEYTLHQAGDTVTKMEILRVYRDCEKIMNTISFIVMHHLKKLKNKGFRSPQRKMLLRRVERPKILGLSPSVSEY